MHQTQPVVSRDLALTCRMQVLWGRGSGADLAIRVFPGGGQRVVADPSVLESYPQWRGPAQAFVAPAEETRVSMGE